MNDKTELLHGERLLFDDILKDVTIDDAKKEAIRSIYYAIRNRMVSLAMSFSSNRDQLSQWRGYADDAKGFCIGFEAVSFIELPVHLLQIEYEEITQKRMIQDYLCKIESRFPDDMNFSLNDADSVANLQELFSSMKNSSLPLLGGERLRRDCNLFAPPFFREWIRPSEDGFFCGYKLTMDGQMQDTHKCKEREK